MSTAANKVVCAVATLTALMQYVDGGPDPAELVKVDVYVEALCPYCANFTAGLLTDMFANDIATIADINYVPYGNARRDPEGELKCQHGPAECQMNRVLACAISQKPKQADWFPFVSCVEAAFPNEWQAVEGCGTQAGVDLDALKDCTTGSKGDELIRDAAEATNALEPPHKYVPWIVVNGIPLGANYMVLPTIICAAYTGPRPKACLDVPGSNPLAASMVAGSRLQLS